jgi:uncharacterized protein YeaO (DUF488 family)
MIKIKRVYDPPSKSDGVRILVDRLWPRGLTEEEAQVTEWRREIAPSDQLRKWYGHKLEKWDEFRKRYTIELNKEEPRKYLAVLRERAKKEVVTLVYGSKDTEHNNAVVLRELLTRVM